jgi:hypothetical protein
MCRNWRGGLVGLFVGMLAWGLLSGVLFRFASAQENSPKNPPLISPLPVPTDGSLVPSPGRLEPAPKGITELLADLSAIRAKKEELAKAEKDTLAAIRARLKQQKEELAQLEKKLAELGIETVEPPPPKPEPARDTAPAAGTPGPLSGVAPLPPLGTGSAPDKRR